VLASSDTDKQTIAKDRNRSEAAEYLENFKQPFCPALQIVVDTGALLAVPTRRHSC
jgi:hypothetical protein